MPVVVRENGRLPLGSPPPASLEKTIWLLLRLSERLDQATIHPFPVGATAGKEALRCELLVTSPTSPTSPDGSMSAAIKRR